MDRRDRRKGLISNIVETVSEHMEDLGIEIGEEVAASLDDLQDSERWSNWVYVSPDLGERVREMGENPRDHTVMVRVDEETSDKLDAWVETGAVKSRSEAAALFIREGLGVRADELNELEEAIRGVEQAKANLRAKARTMFGDTAGDDAGDVAG